MIKSKVNPDVMACCWCNSSGTCRNCVCRKNNRSCTNCKPIRLGKCENESVISSSKDQDCDGGSHQDVLPPRCTSQDEDSHRTASDPVQLPTYDDVPATDQLLWKEKMLDIEEFAKTVDEVYNEIVHWRQNLFMIPSGKQSHLFVEELARLLHAYGPDNPLQKVAIKIAVTTCPSTPKTSQEILQ